MNRFLTFAKSIINQTNCVNNRRKSMRLRAVYLYFMETCLSALHGTDRIDIREDSIMVAEFLNAAWPWVACGLGIAIFFAIRDSKKNDNGKESKEDKKEDGPDQDK